MIKSVIKRALGNGYRNPCIELASNFVVGRNIEGDYFEFGVFRGDSFAFAHKQLESARHSMREYHRRNNVPIPETLGAKMRYFAFDSFQGLPPISGADANEKLPSHWQQGQFSASRNLFLSTLRKNDVDLDSVVIVDGWYESTLNDATRQQFSIGKGCIFNIDCDLYESTTRVLEFIRDAYVDGSIIIFDDWFGFRGNPKYGEQRAFAEWREKYGIAASEYSRSDGQRVSFILHAD